MSDDKQMGLLPLDPKGLPEVTTEMKADLIGEFYWEEEEYSYCDASGDIVDDTTRHYVPWTLCKEIYQKMAIAAMKGAKK